MKVIWGINELGGALIRVELDVCTHPATKSAFFNGTEVGYVGKGAWGTWVPAIPLPKEALKFLSKHTEWNLLFTGFMMGDLAAVVRDGKVVECDFLWFPTET